MLIRNILAIKQEQKFKQAKIRKSLTENVWTAYHKKKKKTGKRLMKKYVIKFQHLLLFTKKFGFFFRSVHHHYIRTSSYIGTLNFVRYFKSSASGRRYTVS